MKLSFDITVTDKTAYFVTTFIRLARGETTQSKGCGLVQITATWEEKDPADLEPQTVSLFRSLLLYALQDKEAIVRVSTVRTH